MSEVAELAVQMFIADKPRLYGLCWQVQPISKASCKHLICLTKDLRLTISVAINMAPSSTKIRRIVIKMVDVSYGGEIGFNQAIELSAETLGSVKLVQEKRLLQKFFDEISQDTGKYCFMVVDTLRALELGAVETLIVWENLDIDRIKLRNHAASEDKYCIFLRNNKHMNIIFMTCSVELEEIKVATEVACEQLQVVWNNPRVHHQPFPRRLTVLPRFWWHWWYTTLASRLS